MVEDLWTVAKEASEGIKESCIPIPGVLKGWLVLIRSKGDKIVVVGAVRVYYQGPNGWDYPEQAAKADSLKRVLRLHRS